jgi:hypothetical protein
VLKHKRNWDTAMAELIDAVSAWREWRQAESAYNRATKSLDDAEAWTTKHSDDFDQARRRKSEAWKKVCRLMDALTLSK